MWAQLARAIQTYDFSRTHLQDHCPIIIQSISISSHLLFIFEFQIAHDCIWLSKGWSTSAFIPARRFSTSAGMLAGYRSGLTAYSGSRLHRSLFPWLHSFRCASIPNSSRGSQSPFTTSPSWFQISSHDGRSINSSLLAPAFVDFPEVFHIPISIPVSCC